MTLWQRAVGLRTGAGQKGVGRVEVEWRSAVGVGRRMGGGQAAVSGGRVVSGGSEVAIGRQTSSCVCVCVSVCVCVLCAWGAGGRFLCADVT